MKYEEIIDTLKSVFDEDPDGIVPAVELMQQRIKELESKLYKPCGIVTNLLNRCNNFVSEDNKAMHLVNDCYREIHSLLERIKELENQNKDIRNNLEDWKCENDAMRKRIKELESLKNEWRENCKNAGERIKKLEEKLNYWKGQCKQADSIIDDQKKEINQLKEVINSECLDGI